jgi:S1-C subfamily serine protease
MTQTSDWELPEKLRPRQEKLAFDLQTALRSMVLVRSKVPKEATTAGPLGMEREGYGVVIRPDGLILTVGYLIIEARQLWVTTQDGVVVEGQPLAYDQVTGFGLVYPHGGFDLPVMQRGSSSGVAVGDSACVIGYGGLEHALETKIIARREFAGFWEYLLEDALFTAPAHPEWGGTALVGEDGKLLGIGSLCLEETDATGQPFDVNMFIPIDLLEPILDDMLRFGHPDRPARPWLGLYAAPTTDGLFINGITKGGPADQAGVKFGDLLHAVDDKPFMELAPLFRHLWSVGPAGSEVTLTLERTFKGTFQAKVKTMDRERFLISSLGGSASGRRTSKN